MRDVIVCLREGIAVLDKQIWDEKHKEEEGHERVNDSGNISQLLPSDFGSRSKKKKKVFKSRKMLRNPGTKEG